MSEKASICRRETLGHSTILVQHPEVSRVVWWQFWGCITLTPETVIPSDVPTNRRSPKARIWSRSQQHTKAPGTLLGTERKGIEGSWGQGSLILCLS